MRVSFWILIGLTFLPNWAGADDRLVGPVGWVERIDFVGAATFTARELRDGLMADLEFLAAAQPHSERDEFLTTLTHRVREGYRHHGFPDAEVTAELATNADRVVVRITEGERYCCGQVIVRGGRTVDRTAIERALTEPWVDPSSIPVTTLTPTGACIRWENPCGVEIFPALAMWVPGTPLPSATIDLEQFRVRAKTAFKAQGYFAAKFRTTLHWAPQARSATLVVDIDEEGPPFVFGGLSVYGATGDSARDVLQFSGLKRGQKFDLHLPNELLYRLWHTGRYTTINWRGRAVPTGHNGGAKATPSNDSTKSDDKKEGPPSQPVEEKTSTTEEISFASQFENAVGADHTAHSNPSPSASTTNSANWLPENLDPDHPVSIVLNLELHNIPGTPPLRDALSASDQAMLRFCEWLRRFPGDSDPDLVAVGQVRSVESVFHELLRVGKTHIGYSTPGQDSPWRFRVVVSGRRIFFRCRHAVPQEEADFDQALIIGREGVDWRFPQSKTRLQIPFDLRRGLFCQLRLKPVAALLSDGAWPSMVPTGCLRATRPGYQNSPPEPGLFTQLGIEPSNALLYLRSKGVTHSVSEGVLQIAGPELQMEIDAESGRLIRARMTGRNGTVKLEVSSERGAFSKTISALDEEFGPFTNRLKPEQVWGSICERLLDEFSPGDMSQESPWSMAALGVRALQHLDAASILEFFDVPTSEDRTFTIPAPLEQVKGVFGSMTYSAGDFAALLLRYFPQSDDMRALIVDSILQNARGDPYVARETAAIARKDSTGPLTRFVALHLLTDKHAAIRAIAARRLRAQLDSSAILEEIQILAPEGSPLGQQVERALAALGDLDENEMLALTTRLLPFTRARNFSHAMAPLRSDRARTVRELLPQVIDRLVAGGLKSTLDHRLDNWICPTDRHMPASLATEGDTSFPVVPTGLMQTSSMDDASFLEEFPESGDTEKRTKDDGLEFPDLPTEN